MVVESVVEVCQINLRSTTEPEGHCSRENEAVVFSPEETIGAGPVHSTSPSFFRSMSMSSPARVSPPPSLTKEYEIVADFPGTGGDGLTVLIDTDVWGLGRIRAISSSAMEFETQLTGVSSTHAIDDATGCPRL